MKTLSHGSFHAFLAVLAGAFGAHGLEKILDDYSQRIWHTAVQYHMMHALALVLLGILEEQKRIQIGRAHV